MSENDEWPWNMVQWNWTTRLSHIVSISVLKVGLEGGTSLNFGLVCAVNGLKPWPYLRMKQMKIDTLFKATTQKWHPIQGKNKDWK